MRATLIFRSARQGMSGALLGELKPLGISVTVVEPGAFRTDFAGRSLTQSSAAIDDYAETAGKRRKEHDTAHGTQPGDPGKAAEAIVAAVESDEPPAYCWAAMRSAPIAGSPQPNSTPSRVGSTSPSVPISMPEMGGVSPPRDLVR
jgi:NAD(P)-dependent dehydrogenase (short-subunit alcohol dehydrogenase family)